MSIITPHSRSKKESDTVSFSEFRELRAQLIEMRAQLRELSERQDSVVEETLQFNRTYSNPVNDTHIHTLFEKSKEQIGKIRVRYWFII